MQKGLRMLMLNGIGGMATGALQGGIFLSAFALAIGASNYEIGLLATIGFISQLMQIPGLFLVQKFGKRRAITVICAGISRLLWLFIILIPLLFKEGGVAFLVQWLLLAGLVMALCNPAWNSHVRALVPTNLFGQFFSRRLAYGTALALVLTLSGGYFVDWWKIQFPEMALYGYSLLFLLGLLFGLVELIAIARLPEPHMDRNPGISLSDMIALPVKDANFRNLLAFIAVWNFAVNMAAPFFIIYMLKRIGLSLFMVTVLATTSQLTYILFLRIWGRLGDRYSNKSVLSISCPLFLLAILAWDFTTMPENYFLTIPLLFLIHILSGMSTAGVNLASGNIALKLSPHGTAHAYMTVFGLAGAATGAIAPLAGGLIADFFSLRELSLTVNWSEPARHLSVYALNFRALDFLFGIAFVVGFYALNRLARVKEEGEMTEEKVMDELVNEVIMPFRTLSSVAGIRRLAAMPVHALWKGLRRDKNNSSKPEKEKRRKQS
ncbi:MAG: MFS transporter [bacterium]|nr:MFS transporter [bacterium]